MSEEQEESGNAVRTSVSLPPYLHEWLKEVTKSKKIYPKYGKFTSNSGVVVVALAELKGRIEAREEIEKEHIKKEVPEEQNVFEHYGLKTDDVRKVALKKCPRCNNILKQDDRFCSQCNLPLSMEALQKIESYENQITQVLEIFASLAAGKVSLDEIKEQVKKNIEK